MITVTKQQMIDYCFAQPDDRQVDFEENYARNKCGCVMVQYGKDNGIEFEGCGYRSWEASPCNDAAHFESGVSSTVFQPTYDKSKYTYKKIKRHLREMNLLPTSEMNDAKD